MTFPQVTAATLLRLLLASLIVGALMAWLGVTPREVVGYVTGFFQEVFANATSWIGSAISYVLLGAVIVVPIWLVAMLLRTFKR